MPIKWLLNLTALALTATAVNAQTTYPDRAVRMIVPFSAGGGTDLIARLIAQKLSDTWGQPVIVENKTGANGNIGAQFVAQSKPDGYTILVSSSAVTINPELNETAGYQAKDLLPVIQLASSPFLLVVNPKLVPANTLAEFIALAKSRNGTLAWASTSEGNAEHLAGSLLQQMGGFTMRHIPYKGGADALKDVVGGHVEAGVISLPTSQSYLQSGQLKVIATTETRRAPQLPQAPTIAEAGIPGFALPTWYGVWLPAATPPAIADRINSSIEAALKSSDAHARVVAIGFNPAGGPRAAFADYNKAEAEKYAKMIQSLGLKKQQ
jgi:tripartite-type tricarboxylate transporter receptor subunit TctC